MWPFENKKPQKRILVALKKCSCGKKSYGILRADDAVHCSHCGAMYLIYRVSDPVAKFEWIDDK